MPRALVAQLPLPFAPSCHPGQIPCGEGGRTAAVWICEYPYRTIRQEGPSSDCAGCPVWEERELEAMFEGSNKGQTWVRPLGR